MFANARVDRQVTFQRVGVVELLLAVRAVVAVFVLVPQHVSVERTLGWEIFGANVAGNRLARVDGRPVESVEQLTVKGFAASVVLADERPMVPMLVHVALHAILLHQLRALRALLQQLLVDVFALLSVLAGRFSRLQPRAGLPWRQRFIFYFNIFFRLRFLNSFHFDEIRLVFVFDIFDGIPVRGVQLLSAVAHRFKLLSSDLLQLLFYLHVVLLRCPVGIIEFSLIFLPEVPHVIEVVESVEATRAHPIAAVADLKLKQQS